MFVNKSIIQKKTLVNLAILKKIQMQMMINKVMIWFFKKTTNSSKPAALAHRHKSSSHNERYTTN